MDFNEKRLHYCDLEPSYAYVNFFPPINCVSWWHAPCEWSSIKCSRRIFIERKMTERMEQRTWFRIFFTIYADVRRVRSLANHWNLVFRQKKVWIKCAAPVIPSFSLQWKSDEGTKHYFTQILLVVNWRYWQKGKNSRMCMRLKVASCKRASLKSTRFSQKNRVGYFSNIVVSTNVHQGRCLPTHCWFQFHFSQSKGEDHPTSLGVICGYHVEPPSRCKLSRQELPLKISSYPIPHDTVFAPTPYTGRENILYRRSIRRRILTPLY